MDDATSPAPQPHPRPRPAPEAAAASEETPGPRHAAPAQRPEPQIARRGPSRRWLLVSGAAVAVGGAAGVAAELVQRRVDAPADRPPQELVAALAAERALIADLDATTGGMPAVRRVVRQARANHAAHLQTLRELVATYSGAASESASPSAGTPTARGIPRTRAQLRAAEQRASSSAAARAARLDGAHAALLASIAACEATHADLLA